jgi:hypothetical protein
MHPHDRNNSKVTSIQFSAEEIDSLWNQLLTEHSQVGNDDFIKEFKKALRMRAMRKLALFSGDGLEMHLATGPNYRSERWLAQESADGGIVLKWADR